MASIEFPLSFTRQYSGPLDTTEVFDTLADLNTYIASNPIAYAGQIVSISADGTLYIIMDDPDSPGTLILNTAVDQDGLDLKADKSTTYTETEVDGLLNDKPSSADYDNIVQLTQTAYNAIGTPASTTLYIIVG
jgi:hypothetical protein